MKRTRTKTVTFHRAHNYGAVLQAYALQNYLETIGYENTIIDYINPLIEKTYKPFYLPYNNLKDNAKRTIRNIWYYHKNIKRINQFKQFNVKYLKTTKPLKSIKDVQEAANGDTLITGSDQVWNRNITGGLSDIFTLNFGTGNKISYAASVGNNELLTEYRDEYRKKISSIKHLSVREESTSEIINNELSLGSKVVLDPVFLLESNKWEELARQNSKANIKKPYIFAYMIKYDKRLVEAANLLSNKTNLPIIDNELRNKGYNNRAQTIYTKGPWDFIKAIIGADYVVTQSFHATVFSILFHKKFFVIPHPVNGARTIDLLKKYNLSDREFHNTDELSRKDIDKESDWTEIDKAIKHDIKNSKEWLKNALEEKN